MHKLRSKKLNGDWEAMINRRYTRVLWNTVRERHFTNEATLTGFEPTFEISQRCTISAQPCAVLRATSEAANQPVCNGPLRATLRRFSVSRSFAAIASSVNQPTRSASL